jgi:hypothetical protein
MRTALFFVLTLAACSSPGEQPAGTVNLEQYEARCNAHADPASCTADDKCVNYTCCPGKAWACVAAPGFSCPVSETCNEGICDTFTDQASCDAAPACFSVLLASDGCEGSSCPLTFSHCANGPAPCVSNGGSCSSPPNVLCPSPYVGVYDEATQCSVGCVKASQCGE